MNKTLYLIFICLLLCAGTHLVAQTFDYNRVSGHPRLLMKQGEEQQIRESLKDNPEAGTNFTIFLAFGNSGK